MFKEKITKDFSVNPEQNIFRYTAGHTVKLFAA